jgi:predicted SAM-dependent methyltransferase
MGMGGRTVLTLAENTVRFRIFIIVMIVVVGSVGIQREFGNNLYIFYRQNIRDPGTIQKYFATEPVKKLQLGAGGNNAEGWLNSDIEPQDGQIYLDVTSKYPFADGSFQYLFAEHVIEHVSWEGGLKMLRECFRVLGTGGKVRIETPDFMKFFYILTNKDDPEVKRFIAAGHYAFDWPDTPVGPAYAVNRSVRDWGHQFIYDADTLRRTFELAGFKNIRQVAMGEKTDPIFERVRLRKPLLGDLWIINQMAAMAFEATK